MDLLEKYCLGNKPRDSLNESRYILPLIIVDHGVVGCDRVERVLLEMKVLPNISDSLMTEQKQNKILTYYHTLRFSVAFLVEQNLVNSTIAIICLSWNPIDSLVTVSLKL